VTSFAGSGARLFLTGSQYRFCPTIFKDKIYINKTAI